MEVEVHGVEPEAVDAAFEPEPHRRQQPVLHVGVVEVEVGLLGEEVVQVVLIAPGVPGPGAAAEQREPVVRRRAVKLRVGPDVPVGLRVGPARAALAEERVPVGGVRQHLVDDHLQPERVRARHHGVEVGERAEDRVDVCVVGDVVAHVGHRRGEDRRQPDRVDPEIRHVGQALRDAGEVADPVAVRVLERARIDLVCHRPSPPVVHDRPPIVVAPGPRKLLKDSHARL